MNLRVLILIIVLLVVCTLPTWAQKETVIKPGPTGKAKITSTSEDAKVKAPDTLKEIQQIRLTTTNNLAKLAVVPNLGPEDILFIDAPSDNGKKILLLWKHLSDQPINDINYIVAWSPDGENWSPRAQMLEFPYDPEQNTRLIDYWDKAEPKECRLGRFDRYSKYKNYIIHEFTDLDFLWFHTTEWADILKAASFGINKRINDDLVAMINKTNPTLSKSSIREKLNTDTFIQTLPRNIDSQLNAIQPWGPNENELVMTLIKIYNENLVQKLDYYANLFGISAANLKSNLKELTPSDQLIVAVREKYNGIRSKMKKYKISATKLPPEDRVNFNPITELRIKFGVVVKDDMNPQNIRWLTEDLRVKPVANLFSTNKLNVFIISIIIAIVIMYNLMLARRNPNLYIRRINGLEAVEEAIGRATEMGKPIIYLTGAHSLSSLSTLAAIGILGKIASKVADYECDLLVPHRDPIVLTVTQEAVREAYMNAGRIDAYKEENIFFLTDDQFAYTAGVNGIMMRERPAANFFMGYYYAEALLLSETGAGTGAIQIAGSDALNQLPFFITTCDYTLIGEELYAASAYLSREALMLGSLRGQDKLKLVIMILVVLGCLLPTIGMILADITKNADLNAYFEIIKVIFYQFE